MRLSTSSGPGTMQKRRRAELVASEDDDAAAILNQASDESITFTEADRKRVLRKIDLWVAVPLCIVYNIQSLDKATLGYASVFNLIGDTHLVGSEYSWLSRSAESTSKSYIVSLALQCWIRGSNCSSNRHRLTLWWFGRSNTGYYSTCRSWCVCTLSQAAAKDFKGLLIARIFLGVFEATILPSFGLIVQMWWTRREQSYRTVAYQVALSTAGIIVSNIL